MQSYPCILMLGIDDPNYSMKYDGSFDKVYAKFAGSDIQMKKVARDANTCRHCTELNYCCPCIPYIQDELKDYRCKGHAGKGTLMGCPLVTVRLW